MTTAFIILKHFVDHCPPNQLISQKHFPGTRSEYTELAENVNSWKASDRALEPVAHVPRHLSALIIHGLADDVVPIEEAAHYASILPNHKMVLIEDADHNFKSSSTTSNTNYNDVVVKEILTYFLQTETCRDHFWKTFGNYNISVNPFKSTGWSSYYNNSSNSSRIIPVVGVKNFRDIGGLTTTDGGLVKRGIVFRSGL